MEPRERARLAYERGRWWVAAGRAAPGIGYAVLAWLVGTDVSVRVLGAAGLVVLVAVLVHRGGALGRAAPFGMMVGLLPFGLPLVVQGNVCSMASGSCATWCLAACSIAGAAAGGWLGARSAWEPDGGVWLAAGLGVAACCGAMGCVCAGAGGVVAMLVAAAAVAPVARAALRAHAAA